MIELKRKKLVSVGKVLVLIVAGLILNLILAKLMLVWSIPLFLDCVGTILVAMIGGTLPAIVVGFFSNVFNGISDPITLYYGVINALIAVLASFFYRKGVFRSIWKSALAVLAFAAVGGALGSVMTAFQTALSVVN